jgi:bla regulator protein BlaR1
MMMIPAILNASWTAALVNHLWQSTVVAAIAWLLVLTLRNNPARTRYWVWMIASLKFLVPFSLLVTAGEWARSFIAAPIQKPALAAMMEQVALPFPQTQSFAAAGPAAVSNHAMFVAPILIALWACGSLALAFCWWRKWRRIRIAVWDASPRPITMGVPMLSSSLLFEPGVFGIIRPVLLLPEGILDRLTPAQLDAVVAHEMCHVRRRDNLTFAIHMVVETLFWFHPLVWWIGARLVEERELACDEAVLQSGNEAEVYAEGILNVCKFYVESPLACVSGVSGSDLKKRIVRIMTEKVARRLDLGRKLLLGAVGLAAVAAPLVLGLAHTTQLLAQSAAEDVVAKLPKFEVSTIKPNTAGDDRRGIRFTPDGISMTGVSPAFLLRLAFSVEEDRMLALPGWAKSNQYDIDAKVDASDAPKLQSLTFPQRNAMFLPLLVERFNLKYHHETKELPVYELVIAKGGSKLTESKPEDAPAPATSAPHRMMMRMGGGSIEAKAATISNLIQTLAPMAGRTIIDKTGLTGSYDYTLKWTPDLGSSPMPPGPDGGPPRGDSAPDAAGPSLFTALQEQLGLKLESQKGPVDVIVIDHIDPPSAN